MSNFLTSTDNHTEVITMPLSKQTVYGRIPNPMIRYRNCLLMRDIINGKFTYAYLASKYNINKDRITRIVLNMEFEMIELKLAVKTIKTHGKLQERIQKNKVKWLKFINQELDKIEQSEDFHGIKAIKQDL